MKRSITIEFDSHEHAQEFCTWLCESGEQSFWEWCDYGTEDEPRPASNFDYYQGWEFVVDDKIIASALT